MSEMIVKIVTIFAILAAFFLAGFFAGSEHQKAKQAEVAIDQRRSDDHAVAKIEADAEEDEEETQQVANEIKQIAPDWAHLPIPGSVLERLRERGL